MRIYQYFVNIQGHSLILYYLWLLQSGAFRKLDQILTIAGNET